MRADALRAAAAALVVGAFLIVLCLTGGAP